MVLMIGFSFLCVPIIFWHEYLWLIKRRKWNKSKGIITKYAEDDDGDGYTFFYPVVEWSYNKAVNSFTSRYSVWHRREGQEVLVIHAQDGSSAEVYTAANRWLFTLFPIFLWSGAIFIQSTPLM